MLTATLPPLSTLPPPISTVNQAVVQLLEQYKDVTIGLEVILPGQAKLILSTQNKINRKKRTRVVGRYSREITNDRWKLSDSAICFNTRGDLINGQHRLEACVESGCPIIVFVARNMPDDCLLVMDQNLLRQISDLLKFSGVDNANAALGQMVNTVSSPCVAGDSKTKMTSQEAISFYAEHASAINFALEAFGSAMAGVCRVSAKAAVARAWYHVSHERLLQFVQILKNQIEPGPNDDAAVVCRAYLKGVVGSSSGTVRKEVHFKVERAIQGFMRGERMSKLYAAPAELYPLPEEK